MDDDAEMKKGGGEDEDVEMKSIDPDTDSDVTDKEGEQGIKQAVKEGEQVVKEDSLAARALSGMDAVPVERRDEFLQAFVQFISNFMAPPKDTGRVSQPYEMKNIGFVEDLRPQAATPPPPPAPAAAV